MIITKEITGNTMTKKYKTTKRKINKNNHEIMMK